MRQLLVILQPLPGSRCHPSWPGLRPAILHGEQQPLQASSTCGSRIPKPSPMWCFLGMHQGTADQGMSSLLCP